MKRRYQGSSVALALAGGLSMFSSLSASSAQACSCGTTTWPSWPYAGAADVPLEPSIVVMRASYPQVSAPAYLEATDGTIVSLEFRNTIERPNLCIGQVEFLKPAQTLRPLTTYTVKFDLTQVPGDTVPAADYRTLSFTTGTPASQEQPTSAISVDAFHVANYAQCAANQENCRDFLEVKVGSETYGGPPTWVRLSTASQTVYSELTAHRFIFDPRDPPSPQRFTGAVVPLVARDECVNYERFDVHGDVIEQRDLCEFSKCAEGFPDMISCRPEYLGFGATLWDKVNDDSCAAPPQVYKDRDSGEWVVVENKPSNDDAGAGEQGAGDAAPVIDQDSAPTKGGQADDDEGGATASTCSVRTSAGSAAWAWLTMPPLAALLWSRRRRARR